MKKVIRLMRIQKREKLVFISLGAMVCLYVSFFGWSDEPRMNQIQVIGTHNSYHKLSKDMDTYKQFFPALELIEYEHAPLETQLSIGMRNFELDLHYHVQHGWQVLHVPRLDTESHCQHFHDCLSVLRDWSIRYPNHVPICVILDVTNQVVILDPNFREATKDDLHGIDQVILNVLGPERILKPDDVRGNFPTLEEAILHRGWPELYKTRGKFYFVLHALPRTRELYIDGNTRLEGRCLFVNSQPGTGYASVMIIDNPYESRIPDWVKRGYIVKVFGGDPQLYSLEKCKEYDNMAFTSGAHIIATDYPECSPHPKTGYFLTFPDKITVRWNPILAPENVATPPETLGKNNSNDNDSSTKE